MRQRIPRRSVIRGDVNVAAPLAAPVDLFREPRPPRGGCFPQSASRASYSPYPQQPSPAAARNHSGSIGYEPHSESCGPGGRAPRRPRGLEISSGSAAFGMASALVPSAASAARAVASMAQDRCAPARVEY